MTRLIDTLLNNRSQLAGFSKAEDLSYFLRTIAGIEYRYALELAPTQDMLDRYKKQRGSWQEYEAEFIALISRRQIEDSLDQSELAGACLLCSEDLPAHCHRRLVAEYLRQKWGDVEIVHLR